MQVWIEGDADSRRLVARVSAAGDVVSEADPVVTGSVDRVLEVVERWLRAFAVE